MSAYVMICLLNREFNEWATDAAEDFKSHEKWNDRQGGKNSLNNLRLIIQPAISFNLTSRWLKVFTIHQLSRGFPKLVNLMNEFDCLQYFVYFWKNFYYSSA